jgi:hypothetical protein
MGDRWGNNMFIEEKMCNEYGLSCIEDYVLYLLNCYVKNWRKIFFKSYIDFEEILNQIFLQNKEYSTIDFIERIQKTLNKEKILLYEEKPCECLEKIDVGDFFLLQIKPQATKELFHTVTWREDHYILVRRIGIDHFEYMNDRPFYNGTYSYKELMSIAEQNMIKIGIINDNLNTVIHDENIDFLKRQLNKKNLNMKNRIYFDAEKLRDCVGIYKVVVRRLDAFFSEFCDSNLFVKEINVLDNIYLRLEYINIREIESRDVLEKIVNDVVEVESNVKKIALERMDKIYEKCS